uniref:Uncharacterized protein n=1 Tax=Rhizophora mucronata TaxID=61149 RepID=A0A2P2IYB2_RHIMU
MFSWWLVYVLISAILSHVPHSKTIGKIWSQNTHPATKTIQLVLSIVSLLRAAC